MYRSASSLSYKVSGINDGGTQFIGHDYSAGIGHVVPFGLIVLEMIAKY